MTYIEPTLKRFEFESNLIKSYEHWYVLLRINQVTLGSLVLVCREDVDAFSKLSPAALESMTFPLQDIERVLGGHFHPVKINYLMLMHKDPAVHFHVIPRYTDMVEFNGEKYYDPGWPGLPNMDNVHDLGLVNREMLKEALVKEFGEN